MAVTKTQINLERLYYRIGDVSKISGVKPHVLRYWETEFSFISPEKSVSGQRVYRRKHIQAVLLIKNLLYRDRYSIEGARNRMREMKKTGALKDLKVEVLEKNSMPLPQDNKQIQTLVLEISKLTETPIEELFQGG